MDWINEKFNLDMNYQAVNKYLKRHFGTKLKVGRKSHVNKDENAAALFKKTV
jgi:transposase